MKVLVDLFACQTKSRYRGIGRYISSLMNELIQQRREHTFAVLANALYPESFEELRQEYIRQLGPGAFKPYFHPRKTDLDINLDGFCAVAEPMVSQSYQAAAPDITLIPSVFESQTWIEEGVVPLVTEEFPSSKKAAILYDLIPYVFPEQYLGNSMVSTWYHGRVESLKNFDLLLAISESTRQDAIRLAGIQPEKIVNISGAVTDKFRKKEYHSIDRLVILRRLGITKPFVLCGANHDYRKNLDGMIRAYGRLPFHVRNRFQLVLNQVGEKEHFLETVRAAGVGEDEIVITGYIEDEDLVNLYNLCHVFVFPSLYEGFGLPVLEAMACGVPVIASNNSSIPEILDRPDALFDAADDASIAEHIERALTDDDWCEDLRAYGQKRARLFSWQRSAEIAWESLEKLYQAGRAKASEPFSPSTSRSAVACVLAEPAMLKTRADLLNCLNETFAIDVFVTQDGEQIEPGLRENLGIFDLAKLSERWNGYETVLYSVPFARLHEDFVALMRSFPGVVDFVTFDSVARGSVGKGAVDAGDIDRLLDAHGIKAVVDIFGASTVQQHPWPMNWDVLKYARKLIVHDPGSIQSLEALYGNSWYPIPSLIPGGSGSAPAHELSKTAEAYAQVIRQAIAERDEKLFARLIETISRQNLPEANVRGLAALAASNWSLRDRPGILIDVTRIAQLDLKSGIQRVVKNLIREFCKNPQQDLRIELVRFQQGKIYRAKRFTESLFALEPGILGEESQADINAGDTLFLLDLELEIIHSYLPVLEEVRRMGGKIVTTVYDLIPLRFPFFFNEPTRIAFDHWLRIVARNSDLLLCISKATADDVAAYIEENLLEVPAEFNIDYFHLGGDVEVVQGEGEIREELAQLAETVRSPFFLMVGTVEPRKGHAFVLDAFEDLWRQGKDYQLCITGRMGWGMEDFQQRLLGHPELGRRLLLFEKPSDAEINLCYSIATALVTASVSEGFGLPIWEAAVHGVPSIASDIPVFREVGRAGAVYFSLDSTNCLTNTIDTFLEQTSEERKNMVQQVEILSWQKSAEWALDSIFGRRKPYQHFRKQSHE